MIELRIDGRGESWPPRDRRITRRVWRVYSRAAAIRALIPRGGALPKEDDRV